METVIKYNDKSVLSMLARFETVLIKNRTKKSILESTGGGIDKRKRRPSMNSGARSVAPMTVPVVQPSVPTNFS